MQRKIIDGADAQQKVEQLLNAKKDIRLNSIAVLTLEEVNLLIDTLKVMKDDLNRTVRDGSVHATGKITHYGYKFSAYHSADYRNGYFSITPDPGFPRFSNLLIELLQQKRYLERLEKIQDQLAQKKLIQRTLKNSTEPQESDPTREEITESIKSAQDNIALEALESYHHLLNTYKALHGQFETLQIREAEEASLLQSTRSHNSKLQEDIKQLTDSYENLRDDYEKLNKQFESLKTREAAESSELQSTRAQNTKSQQDITQLTSQLSASRHEISLLNKNVGSAEQHITEQKIQLSRLKNQEPLITTIKREDLSRLITTFDFNTTISLFSSSNTTLNKIKELAKSKQDAISIQHIKSCITDQQSLNVFENPYDFSNTKTLSKSQVFVRELAFHFRDPRLVPAATLR